MCSHLKDENITELSNSFRQIARYSLLYRNRHNLKINEKTGSNTKAMLKKTGLEKILIQVDRLTTPKCKECSNSNYTARLHCCLSCVYTSCKKHQQHNEKHVFRVDFQFLKVFCCKCKGYIYPIEFERIEQEELYNVNFLISRLLDPTFVYYPLKKTPIEDVIKIKKLSTSSKCNGIRGLWNMGATCFMNTILQAILNNPILKTYYLSNNHKQCSTPNCMSCQLLQLFQTVFLINEFHVPLATSPVTPHEVLYTMWVSQKHIAGYSQQDAHEFFISLLDELHKTSQGTMSNCSCIVHKTFGGKLQSDLVCCKCGFHSFTNDPFLDLSLEIKDRLKLSDCLEEYTQPEKLLYQCKQCGHGEATKQLSIKVLPPVLAIQLKTYEHVLTATKIDHQIKVPGILDMTPHTTLAVKKKSKTYGLLNSDSIPFYQYELYSVVCHQGTMETGHYKSFCKIKKEWYMFDDHHVKSVDEEQVLKQVPYMCFYIRSHCEYLDSSSVKTE